MKVTILHNTDRDASFGLNARLEPGKQITQPRSHQLVRVFQFEQPEDYLQHVLEDVYWRLSETTPTLVSQTRLRLTTGR